jgi:SLT domain-containing protein
MHWKTITGAIAGTAQHLWQNLVNWGNDIRKLFTHTIPGYWDQFYSAVKNTGAQVIGWFAALPGRLLHALFGLGHSLYAFGHAALSEFWNGLKSVGLSVVHWFEGFGKSIIGVVKKVFGIFSPSAVFADIGRNLMLGLLHGIQHHAPAVHGAIHALGSSVVGWIRQAMSRAGIPSSWLPGMIKLVGLESGGNPRAYNPAVAGASGEHAEGIGQTIPSTFAAYSLGGSIWDPVANLVASMRYIRAVYGSVFNIPGIGNNAAYGGYATGTGSARPGWSWVGERGPELMRFRGGEAVLNPAQSQALVYGGGQGTENKLDQLIDQHASLTRALIRAVERSAPATGAAMADALNGASRRAAYRSAYSARG